ncbi:MAG: zinc ribbon domain-containing protein [Chloroflexota bacterium]|nr:zinc ribbon domain-containing protein [Chloroflexota bacterium]
MSIRQRRKSKAAHSNTQSKASTAQTPIPQAMVQLLPGQGSASPQSSVLPLSDASSNSFDTSIDTPPSSITSGTLRPWSCGHMNRSSARFCSVCGEPASMSQTIIIRPIEQ